MATDKRTDPESSKRLRSEEAMCTDDRISYFHESILLLILSFLPALDVVRTCILSRRWKKIWTRVPCLDFGSDRTYRGHLSFVEFINRFLLKYEASSIYMFRLESHLAASSDAESWMGWAIGRNVKELDISFPHLSLQLPETIFGSKHLVRLKLISERLSMTAPPSASFPCLKTLKVALRFADGELGNALISCCIAIENLCIGIGYCPGLKSIIVHARKLKHLQMNLNSVDFASNKNGCVIDINAPALEDLAIALRGSCSFSFENVGSLSKATINLTDSKDIDIQSHVKCFSALKSVKSLCLSSTPTIQACYLKPGLKVHDMKLTHFTVGARSFWAQLLPYFFCCFQNLEVLRIIKDSLPRYPATGCLCVDPVLPEGLLSRLRIFEAQDFKETQHDLFLLKYILNNCKVLDLVRIRYSCRSVDIDQKLTTRKGTKARDLEEKLVKCEKESRERGEKLRVAQKILRFPRASEKCEIVFL